MKNRSGVVTGIFLLLGAAILYASQMNLISYDFSFWTIVVSIFLVGIIIKSLVYFSVFGVVFPLALLGIIYAKPLGITNLVSWDILGIALLVSIGLSLILRPVLAKHRPWMNYQNHHHHHDRHQNFDHDFDTKTESGSNIDINVRMGSSIRYISSDDFQEANINVQMGNAKVYFENVGVVEPARININVSLGGVDLYLPANWNVVKEMNDNTMGGFTEVGQSRITEESPTVTIRGYLSMSGVKINYI